MRLYKNESARRALGEKELFLTDDEVVARDAMGETRIKWIAIEKIVEIDRYIYLFLTSISALVVPKGEIADDRVCREFVAVARRLQEAAKEAGLT